MEATTEFSPAYTLLTVHLDPGEAVKVEPGAMAAQQGVEMKTGFTGGGIFGGIRRMLAQESFFVNTFTAGSRGGWVAIAPTTPGDTKTFELEPARSLFVQGGSFLASDMNVQIDTKFQGFRGFLSGESMFFLRAYTESGNGTVFANAYGGIKEIDMDGEEELVVDTGHVVAFTDDVNYTIGKVGGLVSLLAGGEGLVMKFHGGGKVWIQTRTIPTLAQALIPFMPKPNR